MFKMKGLSVTEVILSLAIATLLLGLALPALSKIVDRTRIVHVQTLLSDSFLLASRLAVAGGTATVICPTGEGGDCIDAPDWSGGWLVFVDVDGDRRYGDRDASIRRFGPVAGNLRLYSTQARKRIVFQPEGDSAGTNTTFTVCGSRRGVAGLLVVSNTGKFHIANPGTGDGEPMCAWRLPSQSAP